MAYGYYGKEAEKGEADKPKRAPHTPYRYTPHQRESHYFVSGYAPNKQGQLRHWVTGPYRTEAEANSYALGKFSPYEVKELATADLKKATQSIRHDVMEVEGVAEGSERFRHSDKEWGGLF